MNILQPARSAVLQVGGLAETNALAVHIGLAVFLAAILFLKKSPGDWQPLAAVVLAALARDLWFAIDTVMHGNSPSFTPDWKRVGITLFWPTILFLIARFTKLLKR